MKTLVLFRAALNAPRFRKPWSIVPFESSSRRRLAQYLLGTMSVIPVVEQLADDFDILVVDNTGPRGLGRVQAADLGLPSRTVMMNVELNQLGSQNKGAGDIEVWRSLRNIISKYDFVVHHELRLVLMRHDRFLGIINSPREYVVRAIDGGAKTGYMKLHSDTLLDFCFSVDLLAMVRNQLGIEALMEKYLLEKGTTLDCDQPLALRLRNRWCEPEWY